MHMEVDERILRTCQEPLKHLGYSAGSGSVFSGINQVLLGIQPANIRRRHPADVSNDAADPVPHSLIRTSHVVPVEAVIVCEELIHRPLDADSIDVELVDKKLRKRRSTAQSMKEGIG